MREGLTFDDVLIVPKFSDIESRKDVDVFSNYLQGSRLPIISAPMDYVTGFDMAAKLSQLGGYGVVSRFGRESYPEEGRFDFQYGQAIGLNDVDATAQQLLYERPHSVCIDVAHGYHERVREIYRHLKPLLQRRGYEPLFIAGNVATADGFDYLARAGFNAIRVGIGAGSACSTRENTGVGVPQLTAIMDAAQAQRYWPYTTLIADGGINTPGDILKALAAGADAVMLGKMLAGHDESPGEKLIHPEDLYQAGIYIYGINGPPRYLKHYQGQSLHGTNGSRNAPEGVAGFVDYKGPVDKTLDSLVHYIRSGFSYVGARNIQEFRERAEFIKVSPGTIAENKTRLQ